MYNVPINHKTIFLLDHCNYFSNYCGQTYEYDVPTKAKTSGTSVHPNIKLEPLMKTLWTINIESALEYSRIVYDLFPEDKLIRFMISKMENTLNSWNEQEQGQDHLMNIMGSVLPPSSQTRQLFEGEEFINVCKALNISVNSIAQASQLQKNLCIESNSFESIPNSGRIILFTSTKIRNIDQIQEFLKKSIDECNKNIEQINKTEKANNIQCLKIKMIELVIIDVVPFDQNLNFDKEIVKQNSLELRTRIVGSKSGSILPNKLIQLASDFYELSITSVTNIPMKEELNANSSANYDVDILHVKSLHDQLKMCGLIKSCQKEGVNNAISLKWSNPKTNITEFIFSSQPYRITPVDVNSRPSLCLTGFLLGGRCVVLEVPRLTNSNTRISSHVLCNHGNELFMHCMNMSGKLNLEDRPSIENLNENITDYRKTEFIDLVKENMLSSSFKFSDESKKTKYTNKSSLSKIEKITKKWPITYLDSFAMNILQLKPIFKIITQEQITDENYKECLICFDYLKGCEQRNDPITNLSIITNSSKAKLPLGRNENCYQIIWSDLDNLLKPYQDLSIKHKHLWSLANAFNSNKEVLSSNKMEVEVSTSINNAILKKKLEDDFDYELENDKLSKRKKFPKEVNLLKDDFGSVLDYWSKVLNESSKTRLEFYGRKANPNTLTAPLYTHLKIDENQPSKGSSAKIEIS